MHEKMFESSDFLYDELNSSLKTNEPDNATNGNPYASNICQNILENENVKLMQNSIHQYGIFNPNDCIISHGFSNENNNAAVEDLLVITPDSLHNFEPSLLLDDNTVNQFLLPPPDMNGDLQGVCTTNEVPDLLSLQSCTICHEIFASDSELLDHTLLMHVSGTQNQISDDMPLLTDLSTPPDANESRMATEDILSNIWIVCTNCDRVLASASEDPQCELLCCNDITGKSNVEQRNLETMYVCDICNGLFGNGNALNEHQRICDLTKQASSDQNEVSNADPSDIFSNYLKCDSCKGVFFSAEDLSIHSISCMQSGSKNTSKGPRMVKSTNQKMWNCGSCNQLFANARELYRHKRGEDRPEGAPYTAYVCEVCDKVLGSMCALHTHRKMHKVTKPGFSCKICGRRFNQSGHLAIHMRMHTGERPYPCDLCPKAFKVKVERDDHRRTHTGERPFACTACPKTFTAAARLREHARIHTDQRPYTCEICGASFRRPYARTVHTLIHTGQKPHQCSICKTAFRRSGDMWKHKRTIHGIEAADSDKKM